MNKHNDRLKELIQRYLDSEALPCEEGQEAEFERLVAENGSVKKNWIKWVAAGALAAALAAAVVLPGHTSKGQEDPDTFSIIQELAGLTEVDPSDAIRYEFRRAGEGFVMTAHFPDGSKESYILFRKSSEDTYRLLTINNQ